MIYQQTRVDQNTVHLKVVLFEIFAGNDFSERGTQAEAHCERNLNNANCEVLDEKHRMIAVQGIFVGIIIKASGTTLLR